ncbi:MAG: MBOAT family protein [Bacteroidaceae bacterium]|nr:MBOAT family protein [Bacteroidaceae bacterium]
MAGIHFALPGLNWAIPVGISFFTFQAVGYLLDVYHDKITAEKNFFDYALFVSFFPQITSGPISTAKHLMTQIKTTHGFKYEQAREGLQILLWGMFLKVVLADRLGIYVDTVYEHYEHYNGVTCFVASIFYTLQIYGDFAGYSLMAIGVAKTIGFDLINNFNRPYFATSITEFWKRWHISLTRWLTTHVYINLGGNRCSTIRQYMNIMITFLVSGLWHGANWTFVFWGALHGMLQILEKMIGVDPKGKHYAFIVSTKWLKPVRIMLTFLLVNLAWIFFRMPTIHDAFGVVRKIILNSPGRSQSIEFILVIIFILTLWIGREIIEEYFPNKGISLFNNKYAIFRWLSYLLIIALILLYGVLDSTQFIYVNF